MIRIPEHNATREIPLLRLACHRLSQQRELPEQVAQEYSRMKYGDPQATRTIAQKMAARLLNDPEFCELVLHGNGSKLVVASSAYGSIPPSAAGLLAELCPPLEVAGLAITPIKIERQGDFSRMDYDALDGPAREKVVAARQLSLAPEAVAALDGQVILLLDDLRSTGAHERALAEMLRRTTRVRAIFCLYWIGFAAPLDQDGPEHEARINHASISHLADLEPAFFQAEDPPRINARVLKFILRGGRNGQGDHLQFYQQLPVATALRLYEAALSRDGYFHRKPFLEGFRFLEDFLLNAGHIPTRRSLQLHNAHAHKVVLHNLHFTPQGQFRDAETDADLSELMRAYSRFKFGGVPEIEAWARQLADKVITEIASGKGIANVFAEAKTSGAYIYLVAPGIRNVTSASNYLLREFAYRTNIWLSNQGFPTMIVKPITRLGSGRANYAELSADERKSRKKSTQSIIPQTEFAAHPIHVIFLDDVEVTGTTADRARSKYLAAGARTFHAIFALRVVPEVAAEWAGIEHAMNQFAVFGQLDAEVAEILAHPEYQPVQRMLRLVLHPANRESLAEFARLHIPAHSLLRLYAGAMANDYLWINAEISGELGLYGPSLRLLQQVMQEEGLLDVAGLPC